MKCCDYLTNNNNEKKEKKVGCNQNFENLSDTINKQTDNNIKNTIAEKNEVLKCLTEIMRGDAKDSNIKERLKAAELLGKAYSIFSNKEKSESNKNVIIFGENELFD